MDRATRIAIVYSLVLSCGKEDLPLLQELSGIPKSTFYRIITEIEAMEGFETTFETIPTSIHQRSMGFMRLVLRLPIQEELYLPVLPDSRMRVTEHSETRFRDESPITEQAAGRRVENFGNTYPDSRETRLFNHGSNPNEHPDSSSFPQAKRDLRTYISTNTKKTNKRYMSASQQGQPPVREWNPKSDHGKLVVYFAIAVHRVRGKDPRWQGGDSRIAFRNAKSILKRGYSLNEGKGVVDYYTRLGRDIKVSDRVAEWIDGYPWEKFVSNFDEYYDRGVRTDHIVIPVPEIDQAIIQWTDDLDSDKSPDWDLQDFELAWYNENRSKTNGRAQTLRLTHYRNRIKVLEIYDGDNSDDVFLKQFSRATVDAGRSLKVAIT